MRTRYIARWLAIVAVAGAGCTGAAQEASAFHPTERVEGRTMEGYKEASYDLTAQGTRRGEIEVWSPGARQMNTPSGSRAVVRVGFTLDDVGQVPLDLDVSNIRLESFQAKTARKADLPAVLVSGKTAVAAGTSENAEVQFELPPDVHVSDISAFRIKWSVRSGDEAYTEFTPFAQEKTREYAYIPVTSYYYPYYPWDYPFYDPFYYDFGPPRVVIVNPYPRRVRVHGHRR